MKRLGSFVLLIFTLIGNPLLADEDVEQLEKSVDTSLADLSKMIPSATSISMEGIDDPELQKLIHQMNADKKNGKIDESFANAQVFLVNNLLKENPFSKMSHSEVKDIVRVQLNKTPMAGNEKVVSFAAEVLQDKKAVLSLIKIIFKKNEMKTYGAVVFVLFILSIILNLVLDKSSSFLKKIFRRVVITVCMFCINLLTFYVMFKSEIAPTFDIFSKHFL